MQTVQLAIMDSAYETALRDALVRSGPWHVESVDTPRPGERCVLVMDEVCLNRVSLPLPYPERVVLLTRKDPAHLSHAWEAGIVSLVSPDDPPARFCWPLWRPLCEFPKPQTAALWVVFPPRSLSLLRQYPQSFPS
jgi:hypothetical protein